VNAGWRAAIAAAQLGPHALATSAPGRPSRSARKARRGRIGVPFVSTRSRIATMYRVPSSSLRPGRMMSARFFTSVVFASISAKWRMRSPVAAFMRTVGWSASSERAKFVWNATFVAARSTGKPVSGKSERITGPGLKPSRVFQSVGSM
jgi:hypothetical protein